MNILDVIRTNLRQGPVTLRYPQAVAAPGRFRGTVQLDSERCIGCGICAYVCTSSAVGVTDCGSVYQWAYDPGRCTFCGRCADVCPTRALSQAGERLPIYETAGALRRVYELPYPRCPECGRPAQPVDERLLARAFDQISPEVRAWSRLCEGCRQLRYQPALIQLGLRPGRAPDGS